MAKKSEDTLSKWTGKASEAEDQRYERTKTEIRAALKGGRLDDYEFDVYAKGSYPNHTNVVRDSDVDVAVELTSLVQHEFIHEAAGLTLADIGLEPYRGDYSLRTFKDDVETALSSYFGSAAVDRGNKALHVRESALSLKADVVVCETLRSHTSRAVARDGIRIVPDSGGELHNFPRQHYDEGVKKNMKTTKRYKRVVRILKRLENEMVSNNVISALPSFLIESLVWNAPDGHFNNATSWTQRVRWTLGAIFEYADKPEPATGVERWVEANNVKYLFHSSQGWTSGQAREFALTAWNYLEFG